MHNPKIFPDVVDFAYEIIRMNSRIAELEAEVERLERYKTDYLNLFNDQTRHTNKLFSLAVATTLGDSEWVQKITDS